MRKIYKFELTLTEGYDEWWEELNESSYEDRIKEIIQVLREELQYYDIEIKDKTPIQLELF